MAFVSSYNGKLQTRTIESKSHLLNFLSGVTRAISKIASSVGEVYFLQIISQLGVDLLN